MREWEKETGRERVRARERERERERDRETMGCISHEQKEETVKAATQGKGSHSKTAEI